MPTSARIVSRTPSPVRLATEDGDTLIAEDDAVLLAEGTTVGGFVTSLRYAAGMLTTARIEGWDG